MRSVVIGLEHSLVALAAAAFVTAVSAGAQTPATSEMVPSPSPAFEPRPGADHDVEEPVTHGYTGDRSSTLDPGEHTRTHVRFDNGTLKPAVDRPGINVSNAASSSEYHAITIGSGAKINTSGKYSANINADGNSGSLRVLNRGAIGIAGGGSGLRAVTKDSPANVLLVNYGTIRLNGLTEEPGSKQPYFRLVVGSLNKGAAPHDFANYSHSVELFNMPGAELVATGPYNGRVDGLKAETGSGHLTRLVNYAKGRIRIEGEGARGLSAQSLWGASQAHNFGDITVNGLFAVGLFAGNCAPWPFESNGCHAELDEIVPDRAGNVPGDVYARNYKGASITTRATTRSEDARQHRRGYGISAGNQMAGRAFAINEGDIDTVGKWSHGLFAYGYSLDRDLDDDSYPDLPDYPDTSGEDGLHAANAGEIRTDGEAAHGIRAEHHRGGDIAVFNSGSIRATSRHSTATESSNVMGISIAALGAEVPGPGCPTAAGEAVDTGVDCLDVYRVGDVVVWNGGSIGAPEGIAEAPSIGIDVVSEGGDVTITHTGSITATKVGIRVRTSGEGRIVLKASGLLNAPKKVEVIGGVNNDILVEAPPPPGPGGGSGPPEGGGDDEDEDGDEGDGGGGGSAGGGGDEDEDGDEGDGGGGGSAGGGGDEDEDGDEGDGGGGGSAGGGDDEDEDGDEGDGGGGGSAGGGDDEDEDGDEGDGGGGGSAGGGDDEDEDGDEGDGGDGGGSAGGGGPPRAAIAVDAECVDGLCYARTGAVVTFRDASSGSIRSRRWDFGGDEQSHGRSGRHSWSQPGFHGVSLTVSDGEVESTASLDFLIEAAEPAGVCIWNATTACLRDSRYSATVDHWTAEGAGGRGRVVSAGTNEVTMFRFFSPDNWEVLIKVLDGCSNNGHTWVFGASTTDLGYLIRIMDTVTGAVKEYRNEPGAPAPAIVDSTAFSQGCEP